MKEERQSIRKTAGSASALEGIKVAINMGEYMDQKTETIEEILELCDYIIDEDDLSELEESDLSDLLSALEEIEDNDDLLDDEKDERKERCISMFLGWM